ncbi:hypothetical protein [Photobacterium leiognathi]|uniref:hypothetical protein n=1 Tax=Photobacterium leiognathi TaxID=553611 RepID=UPI002732575E|nr:hypothetical protein [Photobacterium leiognathi]
MVMVVINEKESHSKVPVTGTVGGDVKEGDTVTVHIGDHDYTTKVGGDKTWTVVLMVQHWLKTKAMM